MKKGSKKYQRSGNGKHEKKFEDAKEIKRRKGGVPAGAKGKEPPIQRPNHPSGR